MRMRSLMAGGATGTVLAAGLAAALGAAVLAPAPAAAAIRRGTAPPASANAAASETLTLSVGRGALVRLPSAMSDVFVARDEIADVQVKSNTQLYVFAKSAGETTVTATNRAGQLIYTATVRVGQNISSVGQMLKLAMPDAAITATSMNGVVLLTGTVGTPEDAGEAARLVQAFVGKDMQVVSRIKAATPMQVNLQVRIVEMSRQLSRTIGFNILTSDATGGFGFGIAQGRTGAVSLTAPNFKNNGLGTTFGLAGKLLGLDIVSALDLAEADGLLTTLATPNLTALSGETASFLAGGEIPIPLSQGLGAVSVEYKQYGVSLAFTPFVLSDGRISMRVRPEVSQLNYAGAVTIGGTSIPGLTTRRAETTVELGSGQSMVIGGLLQNNTSNNINKAPFLGDVPVLGALFRSKNFTRSESELVVVVTPYLVRPVSANRIATPDTGYHAPDEASQTIIPKTWVGRTGEQRPVPRAAPPVLAAPVVAPGFSN